MSCHVSTILIQITGTRASPHRLDCQSRAPSTLASTISTTLNTSTKQYCHVHKLLPPEFVIHVLRLSDFSSPDPWKHYDGKRIGDSTFSYIALGGILDGRDRTLVQGVRLQKLEPI